MELEELEEIFDVDDDEYLQFDRIEHKLHERPDLHAFLLLSKLVPGTRHMISCATHDKFFLDTNVEALAEVVTREQIIELKRCGVMYEDESLAMFA